MEVLDRLQESAEVGLAAGDTEFSANTLSLVSDRFLGDIQIGGDFLGSQTVSDQVTNLDLSRA